MSRLTRPNHLSLSPSDDCRHAAAMEPLEPRVLLSMHTFLQSLQDGVGGVDGLNQAYSLDISPDGRDIYVAGYADRSVAVFSRDAASGLLTYQQVFKDGVGGVDGLNNATTVKVSPDGLSVYVTGQGDNAVAAFSRDPATGLLTYRQVLKDGVGGVDGLYIAYGLAISPNGANVYVTGAYDNAIAVFSRNSATSELTYMHLLRNGVGGVYGLDGPLGVAVSPDGAHVYVTSGNDDSVSIFSRNLSTGSLSFVERVLNGWAGVANLDRPDSVTVSPDGANVYVSGNNSSSVVVFSRNAANNGKLTYRQSIVDGQGGVLGLYSDCCVALSPDGGRVYTCGYAGDALGVFTRDAADNGQLTYVEALQNNVEGISGLNGVRGAVVSPDGRHVYAVGLDGSTLAVFRSPNHSPVLDNSGDMALGTVQVGDASSAGALVSDILDSGGSGRIADEDPGSLGGIAIVQVDTAHGAWQYSLDGGASWADVGSPSPATAMLLPADGLARVRFVPAPGFCGTIEQAIVFRAWDQSSGAPGGTADATTGGGGSAFSAEMESASIQVGLPVLIGDGQAAFLTYTDGDQTVVTITLKTGTAEVLLSGSGLAATTKGKGVAVTGADVGASRIVAHDTTIASSLTVATKGGDGLAIVQGIEIQGPIKSIAAKTTDLQGDLTVQGTVASLALHDVTGSAISLNASWGAVDSKLTLALTLGEVVDADLDPHGIPIKSVNLVRWEGGRLEAPWLGSLNAKGDPKRGLKGDFAADLVVHGHSDPSKLSLGGVKIAGDLRDADWQIAGQAGSLTIGGEIRGAALIGLTSLKSLKAGDYADSEIAVDGAVGSFTVADWDDSDLQAAGMKTLTAASFNRGRLRLQGGLPAGQLVLGSAKVGAITDSQWAPDERGWVLNGDVGSITAGNATGWHLDIAGAAKSVKMALAADTDAAVAGVLGALQVAEWRGGSLHSAAVKSLKATGDKKAGLAGNLMDLDVLLDGAGLAAGSTVLGSLSAAGVAERLTLDALGHAGTVTAMAMLNSHLALGCPLLTGQVEDFDDEVGATHQFTLKSVTLKGAPGLNVGDPRRYFQDSTVGAWSIGQFKFGAKPDAASGCIQYHVAKLTNPPDPGAPGNLLDVWIV